MDEATAAILAEHLERCRTRAAVYCCESAEDGYVFSFSSSRRHTRFSRDWSSDVCSSDLASASSRGRSPTSRVAPRRDSRAVKPRSEERRVGKECRSRWSPDHEKKKREWRSVGTVRQDGDDVEKRFVICRVVC